MLPDDFILHETSRPGNSANVAFLEWLRISVPPNSKVGDLQLQISWGEMTFLRMIHF